MGSKQCEYLGKEHPTQREEPGHRSTVGAVMFEKGQGVWLERRSER